MRPRAAPRLGRVWPLLRGGAGPSGFECSAAAAPGRPAARRHAPQTTKQKSCMPASLQPRPRLTHSPPPLPLVLIGHAASFTTY